MSFFLSTYCFYIKCCILSSVVNSIRQFKSASLIDDKNMRAKKRAALKTALMFKCSITP